MGYALSRYDLFLKLTRGVAGIGNRSHHAAKSLLGCADRAVYEIGLSELQPDVTLGVKYLAQSCSATHIALLRSEMV